MPENNICAYLEYITNIFCFIVRCKCCVSSAKQRDNRQQNEFGEMNGEVYTGSDTYEKPISLQPTHNSYEQNGSMKFACEIRGTVEIEGVSRKIHGFINFLDNENENCYSEENISRMKQQPIFTINPVNFGDKQNNNPEENIESNNNDDENYYMSIYEEQEDIPVHQNLSSTSETNLKKDYIKEKETNFDIQEKYYQVRNGAINDESQNLPNRRTDNVEVEPKVTEIDEPIYENIEEVKMSVNSLQTNSKTEKCSKETTDKNTKMNENQEEIDDYYSYTYDIGKHHSLHNGEENSEKMKQSEVVLQDPLYGNISNIRENVKCKCCGKLKYKENTTLLKEEVRIP